MAWNVFGKIGGWFDKAGGALARASMPESDVLSVRDLSPQQRRAYLGALISSIGSGLSQLGAGNPANIMPQYLAHTAALTEQNLEEARRKKAQEILSSNTSTAEKVEQLYRIGANEIANSLRIRHEQEMEQQRRAHEQQMQQQRFGHDVAMQRQQHQSIFDLEKWRAANKIAQLTTVVDANGIPRLAGVREDGTIVPTPQRPFVKPELVDTGGTITPVDVTKPNLGPIQKTMPPGQDALQRQQIAESAARTGLYQAEAQKLALDTQRAQAAASGGVNPLQFFAGKQEYMNTLLMNENVMNHLNQIENDIEKNGKLGVPDTLGATERGRRLKSMEQQVILQMRQYLGTGVIQAHEMEKIQEMLGAITSTSSVILPKDAQLAGLRTVKSAMEHYHDTFVRAVLAQHGINLPPGAGAAIVRQYAGAEQRQPQQQQAAPSRRYFDIEFR